MSCAVLALLAASAAAQASSTRWISAWTASPQATYPAGYSVGQPGEPGPVGPGVVAPLLTFAFPDGQARDQTLRMIVRPSVDGRVWRVRLSNELSSRAVTFGRASVAVHRAGGAVVPGTDRTLRFSGRRSVTVPAGQAVRSDPVRLRVAGAVRPSLAVNLHVRGASGPMTWHAAAFTTSYLSDPGAGDRTADTTEESFPHSTTSWFYVSGLEVRRRRAATVVALGDSITDGFFSTINGDDRWPDILQRRLDRRAAERGSTISVVNQGIAGNMVTRVGRLEGGCTPCDGPPAVDRLDRDVLGQPGVRAVILLEGINDLGGGGATAEQVIDGMREIVRRVHARGVRIIGATITPSAGTEFGLYGTPETDAARREINDFIRTSGIFDGVADFAAATEDPTRPGHLRPAYDTNSSVGGPGDHLHPNRAGFLAMARAVDVEQLERLVRAGESATSAGR
jgi:lysophospholipase L1-like esterase